MIRKDHEGYIIPVCILCLILFIGISPYKALAEGPMPGGWRAADIADSEVLAAADFAVKEVEKALWREEGALSLISILRAELQIVAGVNYRLRLRVQSDGKAKTLEAIVWWQAWNRDAPYRLTSWRWR